MANCGPSLINFAGGDGNKKVGVLVSSANRQTRPKNRGLRCDEKYASSLGLSLRPPTMPVALRPSDTERAGPGTETVSTATGPSERFSTTGVGLPVWVAFGVGAVGLVVGTTAGAFAFANADDA